MSMVKEKQQRGKRKVEEYFDFSAIEVANFFIGKSTSWSFKEPLPKTKLDLLKINKIVYIGFGFVSAITNKYLFQEDIQAWRLGPVVPSVYYAFKHYGANDITEKATDIDYNNNWKTFVPEIKEDRSVVPILNTVWEGYKNVKSNVLVNLTHGKGSPWDRHYNEKVRFKVIPKLEIKNYYIALIKKANSNEE